MSKFIVFEGIDGCGKTTAIQVVAELLKEQPGFEDREILSTREPGSQLRVLIKQWQLNKTFTPFEELMLMEADRSLHVRTTIAPALERNAIVLCDRFSQSTYAYQGAGQGIHSSLISALEENSTAPLTYPDLILWLDVPVNVACTRIYKRDHIQGDREMLERIRQYYEEICGAAMMVRVDAMMSPLQVAYKCLSHVLALWDIKNSKSIDDLSTQEYFATRMKIEGGRDV